MRRILVAGNWKMNTTADSAAALIGGIVDRLTASDAVDIGVFPPYLYLELVMRKAAKSSVIVGAQNMYCEDSGAFTGEIAPAMLKDMGCQWVLLGHSERRHVFGETDELINSKVKKALATELKVVFCIGELLEERKAEKTTKVLTRQMRKGLEGVSANDMANVAIAYEPVWAIGTGLTATPEQAQQVHELIRTSLSETHGQQTASATRILYGGSVKPDNTHTLVSQPDVDGVLVGGASLKVDSFCDIISESIRSIGKVPGDSEKAGEVA